MLADQHNKDKTIFSLERKLAGYCRALSRRGYEKVPPADAFAEWDRMQSELEILKKQIANGELVTPDPPSVMMQLRTNEGLVTTREPMVELTKGLNKVNAELEATIESRRLLAAAYEETTQELNEADLRSLEQIRIIRQLREQLVLLGSPAYDIDNEIAKLSKELDVLEQEEGSEHPSHEALVRQLDRIMSIRDELEGDAQNAFGPGSTSQAPRPGSLARPQRTASSSRTRLRPPARGGRIFSRQSRGRIL